MADLTFTAVRHTAIFNRVFRDDRTKENSVSTAAFEELPPVTPRPQSNKEGPISRQAMQNQASTSASGQTKKVSGTFD